MERDISLQELSDINKMLSFYMGSHDSPTKWFPHGDERKAVDEHIMILLLEMVYEEKHGRNPDQQIIREQLYKLNELIGDKLQLLVDDALSKGVYSGDEQVEQWGKRDKRALNLIRGKE